MSARLMVLVLRQWKVMVVEGCCNARVWYVLDGLFDGELEFDGCFVLSRWQG
jgi:hypothetical protein